MLLHMQPLARLRRADRHRQNEAARYDRLLIAAKIFDLIVEATGLDDEMTRERIVAGVAPLLCQIDDALGLAPDEAVHEAAIAETFDWLRNADQGYEKFTESYPEPGQDGGLTERALQFRLIEPRYSEQDGEIIFRLSAEALNLFLRALDLDIEDAQEAAEALVLAQMKRGKFNEAVASAKEARLQAARFREKIRRAVTDTKHDIGLVDWQVDVPRLLDDATELIGYRTGREQAIVRDVEDRLEHFEAGTEQYQHLLAIRRSMNACLQMHRDLRPDIMGARGIFIEEQTRQAFRVQTGGVLPDIAADLLDALLRKPVRDAERVVNPLVPALAPIEQPRVLDINDLLGWMLQPRREPAASEIPIVERNLVQSDDLKLRFSPELQEAGDAALLGLDAPVELEDLLSRLDDERADADLVEYVALRVLQLFAPESDHALGTLRVYRLDRQFRYRAFAGDALLIDPHTSENGRGTH